MTPAACGIIMQVTSIQILNREGKHHSLLWQLPWQQMQVFSHHTAVCCFPCKSEGSLVKAEYEACFETGSQSYVPACLYPRLNVFACGDFWT